MFGLKSVATLIASAAITTTGWAGPRDTWLLANMVSDGESGSPGTTLLGVTGNYTARYVHIIGELQALNPASFAREAVVEFGPGYPAVESLVAPSIARTFTTVPVNTFVKLPGDISAVAGSQWSARFVETYDDGAGADARWSTIRITLNDGPPTAFIDLGRLSAEFVRYPHALAPGQTLWLRFSTDTDLSSSSLAWLEITTEGSTLSSPNDPMMALYSEHGTLMGYNDDDAAGVLGLQARMSFGNTIMPRTTAWVPKGTYYLGVKAVGGTPGVGWDFSGGLMSGNLVVNISANFGTPAFCPSDFNKSGLTSVQDVFDFLTSWFAGCP